MQSCAQCGTSLDADQTQYCVACEPKVTPTYLRALAYGLLTSLGAAAIWTFLVVLLHVFWDAIGTSWILVSVIPCFVGGAAIGAAASVSIFRGSGRTWNRGLMVISIVSTVIALLASEYVIAWADFRRELVEQGENAPALIQPLRVAVLLLWWSFRASWSTTLPVWIAGIFVSSRKLNS